MLEQLREIKTLLFARYPCIYLQTDEEERVLELLENVIDTKEQDYYIWSVVKGLRKFKNKNLPGEYTEPHELLAQMEEIKHPAVFVLLDFHPFLTKDNIEIIRYLKELINSFQNKSKNIIILSPIMEIPIELSKHITIVNFPYPKESEIMEIIETVSNKLKDNENEDDFDTELNQEQLNQIVKALKGLTETEIRNVLLKSLVQKYKYSIEVIINEKEQIVKKTQVLEYYHQTESLDNVGGLDRIKKWIIQQKATFSKKAKDFGLKQPKGVLVFGVPGGGKSLLAKAIAHYLQKPLLKLDASKLFSSFVGASEQNTQKILDVLENIGDCILWIDEIEKLFAGVGGSGDMDSGVTKRVFGKILTWMQEQKAGVFVVATANDIFKLPPELLRKGRFDEMFYIDTPNTIERKEIFAIHISKSDRKPKNFDLDKLAKSSPGFTGAEIEGIIKAALNDAFEDFLKNSKADLTTKHILKQISENVPLSKQMEDKLNKVKKWAKTRAKFASSPEEEMVNGFKIKKLEEV